MQNNITSKEEQLKQAIKDGNEFSVNGRPVRLVGKNLFVEVRSRRGRGFSTFTREDLDSINL